MTRREMEAEVAEEIWLLIGRPDPMAELIPYDLEPGSNSFEVRHRGVDYLVTVTRKDGQ